MDGAGHVFGILCCSLIDAPRTGGLRPIRQRLPNFLPGGYRAASATETKDKSVSIRLGIVGGAGWLGGAIAGAALQAGVIRAQDLYRSARPDRFPTRFCTDDNQASRPRLAGCSI
ncbi:hypothetical protein ACVDG8_004650 [Mesorhizobium sp. ORM8.1]